MRHERTKRSILVSIQSFYCVECSTDWQKELKLQISLLSWSMFVHLSPVSQLFCLVWFIWPYNTRTYIYTYIVVAHRLDNFSSKHVPSRTRRCMNIIMQEELLIHLEQFYPARKTTFNIHPLLATGERQNCRMYRIFFQIPSTNNQQPFHFQRPTFQHSSSSSKELSLHYYAT